MQGKGVEEFVQFELEPKILGEARLGYEEVHSPEMFEPHFGVDESGKGDFFGPLVIAGVYSDRGMARKFRDAGVQDSKRIGSDARIHALADIIRKTSGGLFEVVLIGPEKYNQLYRKFGNLNALLGLGSCARDRKPAGQRNPIARAPCQTSSPTCMSLKIRCFSMVAPLRWSNGPRPNRIRQWRPPRFWRGTRSLPGLRKRSRALGVRLGRGVSAQVKKTAQEIVATKGAEVLEQLAKVHFRTAHEIAPDHFAAPPPRREWRK